MFYGSEEDEKPLGVAWMHNQKYVYTNFKYTEPRYNPAADEIESEFIKITQNDFKVIEYDKKDTEQKTIVPVSTIQTQFYVVLVYKTSV